MIQYPDENTIYMESWEIDSIKSSKENIQV